MAVAIQDLQIGPHQIRLVLCIVFIDIVGALAEAVLVPNFAESSLLGGLDFFLFK